jgi:branched-chain amino acid transport system ATP-binding protein
MSLLEVAGLHVSYGPVEAVMGLDLTVDAGQVVVVLGSNGAGKTSTLTSIVGAVRPASGTVHLDGQDMTGRPAHKVAASGIALVPEGRRVFFPLSVRDNLLVGAYKNRSTERVDKALKMVLEMFPILHERRDSKAGLLSGGEQQMLAFGRALMSSPKLILMDEPSMGLSPIMVGTIMRAVKDIAGTGVGILMVEQNAVAALSVGDNALVLDQGRITLRGTAAEVNSHPEVVRSFLGQYAKSRAKDQRESVDSAT